MTCYLRPSTPKGCEPKTPQEREAWAHVKRVFGRAPTSVRTLGPGERREVCLVKVDGFLGDSLEFLCAGGLLIGIPPKLMDPGPPYGGEHSVVPAGSGGRLSLRVRADRRSPQSTALGRRLGPSPRSRRANVKANPSVSPCSTW